MKQLFIDGNNFEASDEWLHTNMMFLFLSAEDSTRFSRERSKIEELNKFHEKFNTIPMSEEKHIISLFRTAMSCDNYVEEFRSLQEKISQAIADKMVINEDDVELKFLYIDST